MRNDVSQAEVGTWRTIALAVVVGGLVSACAIALRVASWGGMS